MQHLFHYLELALGFNDTLFTIQVPATNHN